jgi:hypothetical protein
VSSDAVAAGSVDLFARWRPLGGWLYRLNCSTPLPVGWDAGLGSGLRRGRGAGAEAAVRVPACLECWAVRAATRASWEGGSRGW